MEVRSGGYRAWMIEQGMSASTVNQRVKFFESRLTDWGSFDRSPTEVVEWVNQYAGWTRLTYRNHLRSIYAWLTETDPAARDPLARMRRPRPPRAVASPLTDDELRAVLDGVRAGEDLAAWVHLAYLAGLRAHEIAKIRGEDVTAETVHVVGKGGLEAWVPTHPVLWSIAQDYPRVGWWFPSVQAKRQYVSTALVSNRVRDLFRSVGIEKGSVHRLRHTFATHLVRQGVPIHLVQQLLRHEHLSTTQNYIGIGQAELAAGVRTLLGDAWPLHPSGRVARAVLEAGTAA